MKRYFRLVLFLLLIGAVLIVQAQDATPDPDSQATVDAAGIAAQLQ